MDAERPFVRRDAEHRDEDAKREFASGVALCIHCSSSEGDVMNAFHGSFLLGTCLATYSQIAGDASGPRLWV